MKVLTGKVTKVGKITNTVTVEIKSFRPHPLYKKIVKKSKKILAHLADMELNLGDTVKIQEVRPISKNKHFKVLEVIKDAPKGATFAKAK